MYPVGTVKGQGRVWIKKAEMVDSRDSVRDIKFAPHHMGLKLVCFHTLLFKDHTLHLAFIADIQLFPLEAACSADGYIRIYEAMDIMNLNHWSLVAEFESHKG